MAANRSTAFQTLRAESMLEMGKFVQRPFAKLRTEQFEREYSFEWPLCVVSRMPSEQIVHWKSTLRLVTHLRQLFFFSIHILTCILIASAQSRRPSLREGARAIHRNV